MVNIGLNEESKELLRDVVDSFKKMGSGLVKELKTLNKNLAELNKKRK